MIRLATVLFLAALVPTTYGQERSSSHRSEKRQLRKEVAQLTERVVALEKRLEELSKERRDISSKEESAQALNASIAKYLSASEDEQAAIRAKVRNALQNGVCTVTFIKKDGAKRVMKCTMKPELIKIDFNRRDREEEASKTVATIFDLELKEWRSFRYDRLQSIELDPAP